MVVYNPPGHDCSRFLAEKLDVFANRFDNVLLIGDFNTDLSGTSRERDLFVSMLRNFAMTSIGEEPTFFHRNGCSQLDLFITSCNEKVLRFSQVCFPVLSQHDLIFGTLDFDTVPVPEKTTYRDYVHFNARALENSIQSVRWDVFYEIQDPNLLLRFFNDHVKQVHDNCIPLRTCNDRRKANVWFNNDVRKSILERDLAYKDWLRAPLANKDQARQRYKILRNRTNTLITNVKEQHTNRYLDNRIPPKTLWKRVKNVGAGKDKTPAVCHFHPDEVNRMFLSSFSIGEPPRRRRNATQNSPHSFNFRTVQQWEVVNAIWEISSNATGLDGLPISFIKIVLPLVVHQITHMFNKFIETSVFPDHWKHAKVLPLRKKPHVNALQNLRPISILCSLSKAFEKLLKQQMSSFIADNNLLTEYQAGFRKGQGIQTAALRVYDDLANIVDKKGSAILLLLDFSKAFDTIPHRKLCEKLVAQFSFSDAAVNLVGSYLDGRTQTVFCGDLCSESGAATSGVPQGSVLGPLLFCCHINDLPTVLNYCSIQMYADDVQLYVGRLGPCTRDLIRMVNDDLRRISDWSQRNKLLINPTKSKVLNVKGGRRNAAPTDSLPDIAMDGHAIAWTDSASNLGFVFQSDLKWDGLIQQQCGKVYASLRTLYSCTFSAPVDTRLKLFKALVLPHFLFGDVLYMNPSASDINRLRVALNSCVRYVYGLNRYARVSHLQKNLVGCPLERLFAYRSCLFIRKLIVTRSPTTLYQKLIPLRGRRLQNLVIPSNTMTCYASSLFVRGVVNWNMLPPELKRSSSEAIFKRGCLEFWNRQ